MALLSAGQQTMASTDPFDWSEWMQALGRQGRRVREFLGLSQEELARMAGVSQGAVSRLEAGRGLATPMLVILKINLALTHRLRTADPGLLNEDLKRVLEIEQRLSPPIAGIGFHALPITKDPDLEDLVRLYRQMPERQRQTFLSVVRATARALGAPATAGEEEA